MLLIKGYPIQTFILACIYFLLALFAFQRLCVMYYYRHSMQSFHAIFLGVVAIWAPLRVWLWLSVDLEHACMWNFLTIFPLYIQFASFYLMLYFLLSVLYGSSWRKPLPVFRSKNVLVSEYGSVGPTTPTYEEYVSLRPRPTAPNNVQQPSLLFSWNCGPECTVVPRNFYLYIIVGINILLLCATIGTGVISCYREDMLGSKVHVLLPILLLSFLVILLSFTGYRLYKVGDEKRALHNKMIRLVSMLVVCFTIRSAHGVIAPYIDEYWSNDVELLPSGAKNPTNYQVASLVFWEVIPSVAVLVSFYTIPRTPHPRTCFPDGLFSRFRSEPDLPEYKTIPTGPGTAMLPVYKSVFDDPHRYDSYRDSIEPRNIMNKTSINSMPSLMSIDDVHTVIATSAV